MTFAPIPGDRRRLRIGLLGGSFNPAHQGHIHITQEALKRLKLDQVWWLVSPHNPLKPLSGMAPLHSRVSSARAIVKDRRVAVTSMEADIGTLYTVDTISALRRRFPCASFVWLMGADNLAEIHLWRQWPKLFHIACVAIFDRSPYSYKALRSRAAQRFARYRHTVRVGKALNKRGTPAWMFLPIVRHSASSTGIRDTG